MSARFVRILESPGFRRGEYVKKKEKEVIGQYMLPSYFERDFDSSSIKDYDTSWIHKPIWGREGNGIFIADARSNVLESKEVPDPDEIIQRDSEKCMIQKFVRQPHFTMKTDEGVIDGCYTLSCFMLGTKPSAVYARFSPEEIAGTEAYWAPIGCR